MSGSMSHGAPAAPAERGTGGAMSGGETIETSGGDTIDERWRRVRARCRDTLGNRTFERWIESISLESADESRVTMAAPTRFLRDWVAPRYGDRLRGLWRAEIPTVQTVDFIVRPALPAADAAAAADAGAISVDDEFGDGLHCVYDFENFIVGKPNEFAHAAARGVAEAEDPPYNPLYIYGDVGLGKTHLLHAIGLRYRALRPDRRAVYLSAEKFMNEFVRALRLERIMAFKERLRSVDLLMIDDVQFIGGKHATQEEFFHTFNAMVDRRRQVVVAGNSVPGDLERLTEPIRSRLNWGLVAQVHETNYELRVGILQARVERMGVVSQVPDKVVEFLARKIVSSIRELEGALTTLVARATLTGARIDLEFCQDALRDILRSHASDVTVEGIQKRVAEYYGVRVSDMCSARRQKVIVRPRHVAMFLAKELTPRSYPEIGRKFGNRDHTTVMNAVRRIDKARRADPAFAEEVDMLRRVIEA